MTIIAETGGLRARYGADAGDLAAALALRRRCFRAGRQPDADAFDTRCTHLLIEREGRLAACMRLLDLADGGALAGSYSAQFYDLSPLADYRAPMLEVGRFCVAPGQGDPDILRLAWAALARHVDRRRVGMLFGCASFQGLDAGRYREVFALLRQRHLAPATRRPGARAREVVRFGRFRRPDLRAALKRMPPLLRSYLAMGGWVSDHAVIDRDIGGLHVFTGLEIAAIPRARAHRLRTLLG